MKRAGDLVASGGRNIANAEQETNNWNCPAYGCSVPAACSHSTLGGGPWFCRFHFGKEAREWPSITDGLRKKLRNAEALDDIQESPLVTEMRERGNRKTR